MIRTGLEILLKKEPDKLSGKKIGVLCHAASITAAYDHILDVLNTSTSIKLGAIFGPQHGLFGQTQDNMIEWEGGNKHTVYNVPVYSLYGKTRKPTPEMLKTIEALVIDLQDVGARPYTYIWTVKLCMEACQELGIPVWILDRPNPVAALSFDGPLLDADYFSFVGGAQIPLCHRMTLGEMARLLQQTCFPKLDLQVIWMEGWWRDSLYSETGLPWVLPSPNMPTLSTAIVYPGMVLLEGTNISEGRGSTLPFELFGAPFIDAVKFKKNMYNRRIPGCLLRVHDFIPTFQKWSGDLCTGMQIHVTDPRLFHPVSAAVSIIDGVIRCSKNSAFAFKSPPYEYEYEKMPFDILAGSCQLRECLSRGEKIETIQQKWKSDIHSFSLLFNDIAYYPEKPV